MYWDSELKNGGKASSATLNNPGETMPGDDCFAEKSKSWIYLLAIVIIGVLIFGIINLFSNPSCPVTQFNSMVQPVAFKSCPYCVGGLLDSQGLCDLPGCKVFSPDWGQVAALPVPPVANKAVKKTGPVLIKQFAMEIAPVPDGQGIVVHSVYGGSWAQKAGLEPYDVITQFSGKKVKNVETSLQMVIKSCVTAAAIRGCLAK